MFSSISEHPIAAASLGQVYKVGGWAELGCSCAPAADAAAAAALRARHGRRPALLRAVQTHAPTRPPAHTLVQAVLRETGESVAVKVQRPGVEPLIFRDIFLFRTLGTFVNAW